MPTEPAVPELLVLLTITKTCLTCPAPYLYSSSATSPLPDRHLPDNLLYLHLNSGGHRLREHPLLWVWLTSLDHAKITFTSSFNTNSSLGSSFSLLQLQSLKWKQASLALVSASVPDSRWRFAVGTAAGTETGTTCSCPQASRHHRLFLSLCGSTLLPQFLSMSGSNLPPWLLSTTRSTLPPSHPTVEQLLNQWYDYVSAYWLVGTNAATPSVPWLINNATQDPGSIFRVILWRVLWRGPLCISTHTAIIRGGPAHVSCHRLVFTDYLKDPVHSCYS